MGGTVAVTLRTEDGAEHRMARWTNIFPETVHSLEFISGSLDYWKDSLERFYDMKKDWDDNHEEYNRRAIERPQDYGYRGSVFRFPMTPCYGSGTYLAPEGYGLIVLDQVEKKILEMQGYTSFGTHNIASISLDMDWNIFEEIREGRASLVEYIESLRESQPENRAVGFYDLCKAGKVSGRDQYNRTTGEFEIVDLRGASVEDVFSIIVADKPTVDRFILDLSPYTVERFEEDSEGAIQMRKRVLELGFVLSDEEEKFWQEWIDDELEQEKEDGF